MQFVQIWGSDVMLSMINLNVYQRSFYVSVRHLTQISLSIYVDKLANYVHTSKQLHNKLDGKFKLLFFNINVFYKILIICC